jgi:hypothetical protein
MRVTDSRRSGDALHWPGLPAGFLTAVGHGQQLAEQRHMDQGWCAECGTMGSGMHSLPDQLSWRAKPGIMAHVVRAVQARRRNPKGELCDPTQNTD